MSDSRYRQIFEDFGRDLLSVATRHGKRALREAVRDAANDNLIQEDDEQNSDVPPEELDYPDEDVWTVSPAPDEEESENDSEESDEDTEEDEISEAAKRVASELAEKLERRFRE